MWITLPFGAGSNVMHPNSVGVVATSCEGRTDPGGLTKRIFGLRAKGPIYIER